MSLATAAEAEDRMLLNRVVKGDGQAFAKLFSRYAATANALAQRIVRQAPLAEEIVQEVFMAVWRTPQDYDAKRGSVRGWIMTQIHHRSVDLIRREEAQRRRATNLTADPELGGSSSDTQDPADVVVEAVDAPEDRAAVHGALSELPDAQREVIELMYFGGLSQSKVAERLDVPLGTVKSRTLLGMRRLRAKLEGMQR
jgi:RNA polymerase sigma-70 factor (ECF subfamily)